MGARQVLWRWGVGTETRAGGSAYAGVDPQPLGMANSAERLLVVNGGSGAVRAGLELGAESRWLRVSLLREGSQNAPFMGWEGIRRGQLGTGEAEAVSSSVADCNTPERSQEGGDHVTDSGGGEQGAHHLPRSLSTLHLRLPPCLGKCTLLPQLPNTQHTPGMWFMRR